MAFPHLKNQMQSRYNMHQQNAANVAKGSSPVKENGNFQGKRVQNDVRNTHGPLPKQVAMVNRTQTIQKDINKSHGFPAHNQLMQNKKTLQTDLNGSTGGAHRPGAK